MISVIEKELTVEKMYKLYVDMVGKKGVSKIVLRSVLPIINSELERLLEGVCDFDVEVRMDDKNEVHLMMIKDGVEGPLKSTSGFERTVSSVALRCVLGVVSTLPMPNFIAFDEVLDKVAPDFIPNMKPLFDKIKDMYDKVFIITHDELARDWSDKMITITKKDNVSVINYSH
jgi:DNA repair exonuclease SbcCD ATPase subunit